MWARGSRETSLRDLAAGGERAVPQRRFALAKVHRGEGCGGGARCLCCSADNVTGAQLETMPFFLVPEDKVRFLKTPKALKTFFLFAFSEELPARQKSQIRSRLVKILGSIVNPQCAFGDVSIF